MRATACVGLLLAAGCATYQPRPIDPAASAAAFDSRRLDSEAARSFAGLSPGAPWNLDALARAALYFHPDLDVARAQWAAARAATSTAGQRPDPTLTLSPLELVTNAAVGVPKWIAGLAVELALETAGKRTLRVLRASALEAQTRLGLAQAAWAVRSRLRAAALGLWSAQEAELILEHQVGELEKNENLMTGRASQGESSPFNAAQAVLLTNKSRLALEEVRRRRVDARTALASALGVPLDAAGVELSTAAFGGLTPPEGSALAGARREALLGRPTILAALAGYAASEADLRLELARQYPDVRLGPGFTYDQGADKWGIGFSLPLPVHRNRGPIAEAEARRAEAAARFDAAQARVSNELDGALASYRVAYASVKVADQALARHEEQDAVLRRLLRPGDVSRLTLFRSQLDLDTTRLARLQALVAAQQALGALEDALERVLVGRPLDAALWEKAPRAAPEPR